MVASRIKINDPCPCASGLTYKKCCYGEDEQIRTDVALLDFAAPFQNPTGHKTVDTSGEIGRDPGRLIEKRNKRGIDDFHGLSSDVMHRFIQFPFESPQVVTFSDNISVNPEALVMTLFASLVEAIGEKGLRATAKGNLPRQFCLDVANELENTGGYLDSLKYIRVRREEDFSHLHFTRVLSEMAGLIRIRKGKFLLSRVCKNILAKRGAAGIYPLLFKAYATKFNWGYGDRYGDIQLIQSSFLYSLYLMSQYGDHWENSVFYEDCFLRAFPEIINEARGQNIPSPEKNVRSAYSLRTLKRFAGFMGLIELKPGSDKTGTTSYQLKKLPLLDQTLQFHLKG